MRLSIFRLIEKAERPPHFRNFSGCLVYWSRTAGSLKRERAATFFGPRFLPTFCSRLSRTWVIWTKMAAGGAEEHFAKKLANNEKRIRDKAVNKLRAWIRSRPKEGPGTVSWNKYIYFSPLPYHVGIVVLVEYFTKITITELKSMKFWAFWNKYWCWNAPGT